MDDLKYRRKSDGINLSSFFQILHGQNNERSNRQPTEQSQIEDKIRLIIQGFEQWKKRTAQIFVWSHFHENSNLSYYCRSKGKKKDIVVSQRWYISQFKPQPYAYIHHITTLHFKHDSVIENYLLIIFTR